MSRKAHRGKWCVECKMKSHVCICSLINPLLNQTHITIIMHHREDISTTNTARIVLKMLKNSDKHFRGLIDKPLRREDVLKPGFKPIYLFPSENSKPLRVEEFDGQKLQIIVPDGSWRQAKKFSRRESFLNELPHYRLPNKVPNNFFLRKQTKNDGVSTIEAIAHAISIVESSAIKDSLMHVFNEMVSRTLSTRGVKPIHFC